MLEYVTLTKLEVVMPPHEPQNRKERLAAKAKQRNAVIETDTRVEMRRLLNRQRVYEQFKDHHPLGIDYIALFLETGEEGEVTLTSKQIVTLVYDDESETKPGVHHLCSYTAPFSRGVVRTEVQVLYPLVNMQPRIKQLMLQLRTATNTRK